MIGWLKGLARASVGTKLPAPDARLVHLTPALNSLGPLVTSRLLFAHALTEF
jgi:hypothetical protein